MKNSLFNPENWLWQPFGKVADFLILSALWLFSSIPIITIGSALTALYDCSARCIKNGDKDILPRYIRTFKRELLPGGLSFFLWAIVIGGAYSFIRNFTATANHTTFNVVIAYASVFLLVLLVGIAAWTFPLLSRFTFSVVDLNLTAIQLAIVHLPRTIALGALLSFTIWLCLLLWIPLMIAPGVYGFLSSYILEPVFQTYDDSQKQENEADENKLQ